MVFLFFVALAVLILIRLVAASVAIVPTGTVAVVTVFGKYSRVLRPGLNLLRPVVESIHSRISVQNRSLELNFKAITQDQTNVNFKALVVYAVADQQETTIQQVAFEFVDDANFLQLLTRTVEGSIRCFVAAQRQAEILGLHGKIALHVKGQFYSALESCGYRLIDLQISDVAFSPAVRAVTGRRCG